MSVNFVPNFGAFEVCDSIYDIILLLNWGESFVLYFVCARNVHRLLLKLARYLVSLLAQFYHHDTCLLLSLFVLKSTAWDMLVELCESIWPIFIFIVWPWPNSLCDLHLTVDCWDGPDNHPLVFHGHTLTSKIRFTEVIQVIKDYAWEVSE